MRATGRRWLGRARAAMRRWRLEPVLVAGASMLPTLPPGTRLAVSPPRRPPGRGQVVLVRYPGRDLELVKRVVGLPGERVTLAGATLRIDGRLVAEPYVRPERPPLPPPAPPPAGDPSTLDLTLGPGQYLVLGDRREASTDGRSFGPVGSADILGVARLAYWPPRAWTTRLGRAGMAGRPLPAKRRPRAQANEAPERVE
jgi:signal peptidase I